MLSDLRFALRSFRRTPALIGAAILATALGVGANAAIFSVIQAVLLRPLPYRDPSRLVLIWEKNPTFGGFLAERLPVAHRNFAEWKRQATSFSEMAAVSVFGIDLTGGDRPEQVKAARVTPRFFQLLGRDPALGRSFAANEGAGGRDQVALLSYDLWRSRFAKDPRVLGRTITAGGRSYTVVGVLPGDFHLPAMWQGMEVNLPGMWLPMSGEPDGTNADFDRDYYVFGRLRPGVSLDAARAEMAAIARRTEEQFPNLDKGFSTSIWPLAVEDVSPETRRTVLALQVAVGFVLLIACANVANLLLARAAGRGREMAIRAAMGASRVRLVRQAFSESLLLSGLGGALGVAVAAGAMRAINALAPKDNYHFHEIGLDWAVLAVAAGLAMVSGILFGIAPALAASASNLRDAMAQDGRAGAGRKTRRLRDSLVVAEVAAALILLAGAGLMLRSLRAVMGMNPGFDASHVLTAHVPLADHRKSGGGEARRFCNELLDRLAKIGGVESASVSTGLPMMDSLNVTSFRMEGAEVLNNGHPPETDLKLVSEDYFRTAGVPLLRGRGFTAQDAMEAEGKVVVINQALAAMLSRYGDPLGRTLLVGQGSAARRTIVGVVAGAHEMGLEEEIRPEVFMPTRDIGSIAVMVRSKGDPRALSNALTAAVWSIDKDQAVADIQTLGDHLRLTTAQRQFDTLLFGGFAGLALLLAAVGLYGVLSYSVMLRKREIGVRMALGARTSDVLRLVLGNGLALTLAGVAIGAAGALGLTRLMANIVFGVSTSDPLTFTAVAAVLVLVGLAACYVPARRAAGIDPNDSLRGE